jgi:hypothetical protein
MEEHINNLDSLINLAFAHKFKYMTYQFNFHHVYRGRKFELIKWENLKNVQDEINNISKMWAPPIEYAQKNRCNRLGVPKLYLTTLKRAVPYELIYQSFNDIIAIITYKSTEPLKDITPIGCKILMDIDDIFKVLFENHFSDKSEEIIEISDTFGRFFSQHEKYSLENHTWFLKKYGIPIDSELYDLTIAISENYFKSGIHGLVYPSVAHHFESANFVLKPEYFTEILKPTAIEIYTNFQPFQNEDMQVQLLSTGRFEENENISWIDANPNSYIKWQ